MAKRRDSRYEAGRRSSAWLKIKPTHSAEFVIGGYTLGKGARAPLGALLLGYWEHGRLRYAGPRRQRPRRRDARPVETTLRTA